MVDFDFGIPLLARFCIFIVLLMSVPVAMELDRPIGVVGGIFAITLVVGLAALVESIVRMYFVTVVYSFYKDIKEKELLSSSLRDIATPRDVEIRNGTYKIPRPLYKKF